MSGAPDNHELARQLAVLEERMNTHQAEYRTDIARLAEDIARRDAELAKRDKTNIQWMTGIGIAIITSIIGGFVILGFLTT